MKVFVIVALVISLPLFLMGMRHLHQRYFHAHLTQTLAAIHASNMHDAAVKPCTFSIYRGTVVNSRDLRGQFRDETLSIGVIGDSISIYGNPAPPEIAARLLSQSCPGQSICLVNAAVPASATSDWLPNSRFALLPRAERAFAAHHITIVMLMLGTNDALQAVAPGEYRANMASILSSLTHQGYQVIVNQSPAHLGQITFPLDKKRQNDLLAQYPPKISALCHQGNPICGDVQGAKFFARHPERLSDGIHPDALGRQMLGMYWKQALLKDLRQSSATRLTPSLHDFLMHG